ncbi:hypothetical protein BDC45DRAFT_540344 [Circinella umbellata]|nr:hypothetical protein BDC45DRAFT_540344 [Circinella umbellata]
MYKIRIKLTILVDKIKPRSFFGENFDILVINNRKREYSSSPSSSQTTQEKQCRGLQRQHSFRREHLANACRAFAQCTSRSTRNQLYAFLEKPKNLDVNHWNTLVMYINSRLSTPCLTKAEKKVVTAICQCQTVGDLDHCRAQLFSPNEESKGVRFARGALNQIMELDYTGNIGKKKVHEDWFRINILSHIFDSVFLYSQSLDSLRLYTNPQCRSECIPLHQAYQLETNRIDCIITGKSYNVLFVEEKPPGTSKSLIQKDFRKCNELRLTHIKYLEERVPPIFHQHLESLSINWSNYTAVLRGTRSIEYSSNKAHQAKLYYHYGRDTWVIPSNLSSRPDIVYLAKKCISSTLKLKVRHG